jgi:hypothetical protein
MVISVSCKVKEIFERGKDYVWLKPEICPRCKKSHVLGHGFVGAYFDGFPGFVYLRRWRCPACFCVIRVRPSGYFRRFQATIEEIRSRLSSRISGGHWPPEMSHSRQGNWLRALWKMITAHLGNEWKDDLLRAFDHLISIDKVPVSRSL